MESQGLSTLKKLNKLLENDSDKFYSVANYLPYKIVIGSTDTLKWLWYNRYTFELYENGSVALPTNGDGDQLVKRIHDHGVSVMKDCLKVKQDSCSYYSLLCINDRKEWAQNIVMLIDEGRFLRLTFLARDLLGIGNVVIDTLDSAFVNLDLWEKFDLLTSRELDVLSALCTFNDNDEIVENLGISSNTFRKHKENINRKLGTKNHTTLIRVAEAFSLLGRLKR